MSEATLLPKAARLDAAEHGGKLTAPPVFRTPAPTAGNTARTPQFWRVTWRRE